MDVGVIGIGMMGRNHARIYSELKSVGDLVVFDTNTAYAKEYAQQHDVHLAGSIQELYGMVEAVSICVPTKHHYQIAETAFRNSTSRPSPGSGGMPRVCTLASNAARCGTHLLIEKPICSTSTEAEKLQNLVSTDLVVGVGHIERFNPIIDEIARIITEPLYVEIKRHNPASARINDSTVVEDLMIHDIDIVVHRLFHANYRLRCAGTRDICGALFQFNSTPVYLSASRKSSKKMRTILIEEEEVTIEGDFMNQEVYIHRKPDQYELENERYVQENIIEKVLVNKLEPLKVELSTFLDCINADREFPVTPAQATENLRICERIRESCIK
ncbi:MAG: Gfo/Idh/MocA family oxidoreductase [Methanomicrobiaceae archaeon]|nr:Gfo/Idh/MocA family oxidoreductase [Methanomicrobiaceae archaeon]